MACEINVNVSGSTVGIYCDSPCPTGDDGTSPPPAPGVTAFAENIGDGVSTVFTVVHNIGTSDVMVTSRNIATGAIEHSNVSVVVIDANRVSITYDVPPGVMGERVVVWGIPA